MIALSEGAGEVEKTNRDECVLICQFGMRRKPAGLEKNVTLLPSTAARISHLHPFVYVHRLL